MTAEPPVPKGERGRVGYYNKNKTLLFVITSKTNNMETYFLYENKDGTLCKLGKGSDPLQLCAKYHVYEKMKEGGAN